MAIVELKKRQPRIHERRPRVKGSRRRKSVSRRRQVRSYLRTFGRGEEYSSEPARRVGQSDFGDDHRLRK